MVRTQALRSVCLFALVLTLLLFTARLEPANAAEWRDLLHKVSEVAKEAKWRARDMLFGDPCPYVKDPVGALKLQLDKHVVAQPFAVRSLLSHLKGWQDSTEPLVMAFTGSTGTGKTHTALQFMQAVLKYERRLSRRSQNTIPLGALILNTEAFRHGDVGKLILNELKKCQGQLVIMVDEIQKLTADQVSLIVKAMGEEGQFVEVTKDHESVVHDTSRVIWLLISDVGRIRMEKLTRDSGGRAGLTREAVEEAALKVLRTDWNRGGHGSTTSEISRVVNGIVPFLPYEQEQIMEIFNHKLQLLEAQLQKKGRISGMAWTEEFVAHLASTRYIRYRKPPGENKNAIITAEHGARAAKRTITMLRNKMLAHITDAESSSRLEIDVKENGQIVFHSCQSLDTEGEPGCGPDGEDTCRTICSELWTGKLR